MLETAYACVLAAVVAFLLWVTFTAETPIDRTAAHPRVRIKVIAAQWSWRFIYSDGVERRRCGYVASDAGVCADGQRG